MAYVAIVNTRKIVFSVSTIFTSVQDGEFETAGALFDTLAKTIEEARKGASQPVPVFETGMKDFSWAAKARIEKTNLLIRDGVVAITITKKGSQVSVNHSQLRVWVKKPGLYERGDHADGYDYGCIFEAHGDAEELSKLVATHLAGRKLRFDNEAYILWY